MTPFIHTLLANLAIGATLIGLIFILRLFKKQILKYLDLFTALTVGILLGMIFLGFLPEIVEHNIAGPKIGLFILIGLFVFYLFELFLHHHHCNDLNSKYSKHIHQHKNKVLMLSGTLMHNMLHGIVLFSAYSINLEFGIATTIAILLHSIPQNTANYIMNHDKELHVFVAAGGGILGALFLFPFTDFLLANKFFILAMISGALLYLALSDILPEVKNKGGLKIKLLYLLFIFIGLALVVLLNHH